MRKEERALVERHVGLERWERGKARAKQLVRETEEAEGALTRVQWAWGDLALEVVPWNTTDGNAVGRLMDLFTDEYRVPYARPTMKMFRYVAKAWPPQKRARTSFAAHHYLSAHPDRFRLIRDGMTCAEATRAANRTAVTQLRKRSASAVECAVAVKSWARSLERRISEEPPSDELLRATADAWFELSQVAQRLGALDELVDTFFEQLVEREAAA